MGLQENSKQAAEFTPLTGTPSRLCFQNTEHYLGLQDFRMFEPQTFRILNARKARSRISFLSETIFIIRTERRAGKLHRARSRLYRSRLLYTCKYSSENSRRDLHNTLLCNALQSHFFFARRIGEENLKRPNNLIFLSKTSPKIFPQYFFFQIVATIFRNSAKFC